VKKENTTVGLKKKIRAAKKIKGGGQRPTDFGVWGKNPEFQPMSPVVTQKKRGPSIFMT